MNNISKISEYAEKSKYRFHTPGHGGDERLVAMCDVLHDVTEVDGIGIYSGVMNTAVESLTKIYKADSAAVSAFGATLCLQAALLLAVRKGAKRFALGRYTHISVINALTLLGANFEFVDLQSDDIYGFDCAVLTYPDYFGKDNGYFDICNRCKSNGVMIITDSAHGAHFAFSSYADLSAGCAMPDYAVYSVHKTLPCLTGGAVLASYNKTQYTELISAMKLFSGTSPSYLIAASVEALAFRYNEIFFELSELEKRVDGFTKSISHLPIYRASSIDPFRIVLTSDIESGYGYDMREFEEYLSKYGIFAEHTEADRMILIPNIAIGKSGFDALVSAIKEYTDSVKPKKLDMMRYEAPSIVRVISPSEAAKAESYTVDISSAKGLVAAETLYACPPGYAITLPGARITEETVDTAKRYGIESVSVCK